MRLEMDCKLKKRPDRNQGKPVFGILVLFLSILFFNSNGCLAAGFKMNSLNPVKIGNKEFYTRYDSYQNEKIYIKENGVEKVLVSDRSIDGFTTDGTTLYYGRRQEQESNPGWEWDLELYQVDVSSKSVDYIGSVHHGQSVDFYHNNKLYLDVALGGGIEIPNLCSYSIDTDKFEVICESTRSYFVKGDYIICYSEPGEFDNTGHYMYKICAYNYKKQKNKILAQMGSDVSLYKKTRVRYIKSFTKDRDKRVWTGQVFEYNLQTGKIRTVSSKFKSRTKAEIKKDKVVFYNANFKKKSIKLKG